MSNAADRVVTMKDLKAADPRWCTGCGDYSIVVGMRKFTVQEQIFPETTVHVSGIGCSGRFPHYMQTYGFHGVHGRAIPITLGMALVRDDLDLFIHSGDGDALSIGGNHLIHGVNKNFNTVFVLYDNQIYGLTKQQTSPTSKKGIKTQSHPGGSWMEPINPIKFALGLGATFVASTAEWLGQHFVDTIEKAYKHKGFSFVHVAQRCPKFNPKAWDHENSDWIAFLESENGIAPDLKGAPDAVVNPHDPTNLELAFQQSHGVPQRFGLFYQVQKPCYDDDLKAQAKAAAQKSHNELLDDYLI